jgi:hypothetical protein
MLRICRAEVLSKRLFMMGEFQNLWEGEIRSAMFKSGGFKRLELGLGLKPGKVGEPKESSKCSN